MTRYALYGPGHDPDLQGPLGFTTHTFVLRDWLARGGTAINLTTGREVTHADA